MRSLYTTYQRSSPETAPIDTPPTAFGNIRRELLSLAELAESEELSTVTQLSELEGVAPEVVQGLKETFETLGITLDRETEHTLVLTINTIIEKVRP